MQTLGDILGSDWQNKVSGFKTFGFGGGGDSGDGTPTQFDYGHLNLGDGRTVSKNHDGTYTMWTNGGDDNWRYGADGNFLNYYKGSEDFGLGDLVKGAGVIGVGMGLGGLLSAGMGAAGAGGAAANTGTLSKAALDGTTAFGANSVPGAYSLGGTAAAAGGAGGLAGATGSGGGVLNSLGSKVATTGLSSLFGGGGSSGGGGVNLGDLIKLGTGAYDASQQRQASGNMLDYLKGQQAKIDNLYSPGSPEYNYLMDQMSRQDAAAGRNSQYGPRSVDLAAKIAQIKADATARMTGSTMNGYQSAFNQNASAGASLGAGLGSIFKPNGPVTVNLDSVWNSIKDTFSSNNWSGTALDGFFGGTGGSGD